jgi:hypothetical protein
MVTIAGLLASACGLGLIAALLGIGEAFRYTDQKPPRRPPRRWLAAISLVGALMTFPLTLLVANIVEFFAEPNDMHGVLALVITLGFVAFGSMIATMFLIARCAEPDAADSDRGGWRRELDRLNPDDRAF